MTEILFATNNTHKVEEVRSILGPDFRIIGLSDIKWTEELPETRDTLEGNAEQKARYVFEKSGKPCFADDSGLEVTSLRGAPGVRSARYAGRQGNSDDNIRLLLKNLEGMTDRSARFRTVIALVDSNGDTRLFEGVIEGTLLTEKRGEGGFGYDPIFVPKGHTLTFAEMSATLKNSISHRGEATKKLVNYLKENARASAPDR